MCNSLLLILAHDAFSEITEERGHLPNPRVCTDLVSHSLPRPLTQASEPSEEKDWRRGGEARGPEWGAAAAEGTRVRPPSGRAPYLRCGRRVAEHPEHGGRWPTAPSRGIRAFIQAQTERLLTLAHKAKISLPASLKMNILPRYRSAL